MATTHSMTSIAFQRLLHSLRACEWWVYAKPPFGGPGQVLAYLGRYTHRVAISNHRLLKLEHGQVTFSWRDYRHGQRQWPVTLTADEFIRRFLLHVLPRGFQRIRQFGLLANRARVTNWPAAANCSASHSCLPVLCAYRKATRLRFFKHSQVIH